ncbi:helix-turn-helix domain-containing protein [Streptomyces sp. NPDC005969]|uniref:helix-turn-helix domain-containing protein n=1 Tax=Streptomyces sp. NPDC005969 TaxID=3156722 RepID=UPI0033E79344
MASVGAIADGLERALLTRPVPSGTPARLKFLLKTEKGSTRSVAALLGVSQRTVQRWITARPGARQHPGPAAARRISRASVAKCSCTCRSCGSRWAGSDGSGARRGARVEDRLLSNGRVRLSGGSSAPGAAE